MRFFFLRKRALLTWFGRVLVVIGMNFMAYVWVIRIDITGDQRHSITPTTIKILQQFNQAPIKVKVYLTGELPTGLKRLKNSVVELLQTFQNYSPNKIQIEWVNPHRISKKNKSKVLKLLAKNRAHEVKLYIEKKGQRIQKTILPALVLSYKNKRTAVMLLRSDQKQVVVDDRIALQQSLENLEYHMVQGLQRLSFKNRYKIALLRGHGEPEKRLIKSMVYALREYYDVRLLNFSYKSDLKKYDAVIISGPMLPFSEAEKFLLDQYIMKGGKVLFFLDNMQIDMLKLHKGLEFAFPTPHRLGDMLFRYGLRINHDLIQDYHCGMYPLVVGRLGNQPRVQLVKWPFFSILSNFGKHVVTSNLAPVYAKFISSIDAVGSHDIKKTPLIYSSQKTKKQQPPVHVDVQEIKKGAHYKTYTQRAYPVAYMLEGSFNSCYKNRNIPKELNNLEKIDKGIPTKILVTSTSSLLLNEYDPNRKLSLPWGYDPYLDHTFAQNTFVLSSLSYVLDEEKFLSIKKKDLPLWLLNRAKSEDEKTFWQLFNVVLPLLIFFLFSLLHYGYYRKRYKSS